VCAASRSREGTGERSYRPVLALFADFSAFGNSPAQKEIGVGAALGGPLALSTVAYAVVGLALLGNDARGAQGQAGRPGAKSGQTDHRHHWRRIQRAQGYRYILINGQLPFVDGEAIGCIAPANCCATTRTAASAAQPAPAATSEDCGLLRRAGQRTTQQLARFRPGMLVVAQ
jgi:hypothetical protein